eukprot:snap_masked-scaffold_4-processed-gene-19.25-mRNA-1 protein AED:1.00 eAED:1.00 QI:0/-1/0/0/-1/1/1/0/179
MRIHDSIFSSVQKKLTEDFIFVDTVGNWHQKNWSAYEYHMLRMAIMKHGMSDFQNIIVYLPGKGKQQIYTKLQRILYRQSLEHYHGLRVDIEVLRQDNFKLLNGRYFKLKMSRSSKVKTLERIFCLWRYGEKHKRNSLKSQKLTKIYNPLTLEGLKVILHDLKEKIKMNLEWDAYPHWD